MLSDNPRAKTHNGSKRRAVKAATNVRWSDSQKIEAVKVYLMLGSVRGAAHALQIPEITLHSWKKTEWWQELVKELQAQETLEFSERMRRTLTKALDLTEDRLENGDWIYDQKSGQMKRKPVPLRDIHRVAMDTMDRREKLKNNEQISVAQENIEKKLDSLAAAFAQHATQKAPVEVTDVVFITEGSSGENPEGQNIGDETQLPG